jgi:2-polyprenyl-3-methyl-5-hydroxy-6-metoxy-1,4-benzoquinol methylase
MRRLIRPYLREEAGLFDVIEHVADHHGFLSACAQEMGPGGYIYITVPAHQVPAEALI